MDRKRFTPGHPGKLVEIQTPLGKDWSFIPNELPPRWNFDPKLWPLLLEARETLGTLNGIGQTLKDQQLLLRPLQNREAVTSSKIEGTYVTPEMLLLYEMNPTEANKPTDRAADWMEVHNYGIALQVGRELMKTLPLCGRLVMDMHAKLMKGVRGQSKDPGQFRRIQVHIGKPSQFVPPPHGEIARLIQNLEIYMNTTNDQLDALVKCFIVHYQFETIHPFMDGNGRIGRALLSLMAYHLLDHSEPWLYLSPFFERFKDEYTSKLYKVSSENDWTGWIEFCLRGTIEQAKDSIWRCNEFNRLKREFHDRVKDYSPTSRTHELIESLFRNPIVSISSLSRTFGVAYQTAKADVAVLINAGILSELEDISPKTHFSKEVFTTAYSEEVKASARSTPPGLVSDETPTIEPELPF